MHNIKKISFLSFILFGCTMGDYIPPLLPGNVYSLGSKICVKSNGESIISDYILFEGRQGGKIKIAKALGKNKFVCIDSKKLSENVTYVGHYVTLHNDKKEYYGFNVIKIDGRIFRMNDDGNYMPLI